jgi:Phytochelatin synthase
MGSGIAAEKTYSHPRRPAREEGLPMGSLIVLISLLASLLLRPALAFEGKSKFGPNAAPILEQTAYLRTAAAPDYWKLSPFYVSQTTSSDCSVASITMAINFMLGLPSGAEEPIVTQSLLLTKIADARWAKEVANGGSGVSFAEFVSVVSESLATFQFQDHVIETIRPPDDTPETLATLRQVLATNEASDQDIVLVYFNQGVLTGDWDGPHISPIAAYNQETRQVLIMDVDRAWYVPYWTTDSKLLEAMLRPAPAAHGRLAGETGGLVWIRPTSLPLGH